MCVCVSGCVVDVVVGMTEGGEQVVNRGACEYVGRLAMGEGFMQCDWFIPTL